MTNIPDSISPNPPHATSEQDRSSSERGESGGPVETSQKASKCKDSVTSTVQSCTRPRKRKDRGQLHATRHGVLSRYVLQALKNLGEDIRPFRRLEKRYRKALEVTEEIQEMIFDRFWSSHLRCVLGARIEATAVTRSITARNPQGVLPELHERDLPTLILAEESEAKAIVQNLPSDLIRELVLFQRYDRHFSREMYRALGLLLIMRNGGEAGLPRGIEQILGANKK